MIVAMILAASHMLFDDFTYATREQLTKHGWIVRGAAGWPGVPGAAWGGVEVGGGKIRMTAATDGTPNGTRQAQLCHERKYLEGTYAARVRFSDAPAVDHVVQTFYLISPLREPMAPEYSEVDFEYLPQGGWGKTGPTLFATTWETFSPEPQWKAVNTSDAASRSYEGWHTLVVQIGSGAVRYFVDGTPLAKHGGDVYPESPMSINFNLWFIRNTLGTAGASREYVEEIDWVYFSDALLAPADVDTAVASLRRKLVAFRDTVPRKKPALESPCNF